ncbi:hypothetical protein [Kamptonema sp. UHCC 0994]|uniref:hypothetical protein n=1 Tax=Kamptonema sp. UHCC 0994 TaxID=3031329 RepID=UPI0023B88C01|nr:hypothetical protein [Kamptonema sp. UHCC 0994]MDF0552742.1 hypothetical protein [Kamptonema sp. UHCC 0994]
MNEPISDKKLVSFLKLYRPIIPEEMPDLEQRIMVAIEGENSTANRDKDKIQNLPLLSLFAKHRAKIQNRLWVFPPAIAASLLVAWSGYHTLTPTRLSATEEAHLEAFLVSNWDGAVSDSNLLPMTFPTDN